MQMTACTRQTFLSKTFTNALNMQKQYAKNVWETSNDTYSFSVRVQTTINHISICFLPQYQRLRKCSSSERELKKALRDIDASSVVWTLRPGSDAVLHMSRIEFNELSSCEVRRLNQFKTARFNSDRLSRSSRLAQPGITALDRLWFRRRSSHEPNQIHKLI